MSRVVGKSRNREAAERFVAGHRGWGDGRRGDENELTRLLDEAERCGREDSRRAADEATRLLVGLCAAVERVHCAGCTNAACALCDAIRRVAEESALGWIAPATKEERACRCPGVPRIEPGMMLVFCEVCGGLRVAKKAKG